MDTATPRNDFSAASRAPCGQILVVEDEPAMARCLARVVKRYGKVTAARTMRHAMRHLAGDVEWTAFIVDVGLPDGSGLEVLAQARVKAPDVPALVITGLTEHDAINAAFEFRAAYLVKPVTNEQIEEFLRGATSMPDSRSAGPIGTRPVADRKGADDACCDPMASGLALRQAVEAIQGEQRYTGLEAVRSLWRIGDALCRLRDAAEPHCWRRTLAACARALGLHAESLHDAARAATTFPSNIREAVLRPFAESEAVLTPSHVIELARATPSRRSRGIDFLLGGARTVRDLRSYLHEHLRDSH